MIDWQDEAACFRHQSLRPEAWFAVRLGKPEGQGLDALAVCQRSCPVAQSCYEWYATWDGGTPINVIAGGGWWDGKGVWKMRPVQDLPGMNPYRRSSKHITMQQREAAEEKAAA